MKKSKTVILSVLFLLCILPAPAKSQITTVLNHSILPVKTKPKNNYTHAFHYIKHKLCQSATTQYIKIDQQLNLAKNHCQFAYNRCRFLVNQCDQQNPDNENICQSIYIRECYLFRDLCLEAIEYEYQTEYQTKLNNLCLNCENVWSDSIRQRLESTDFIDCKN
ncbi:hypothetical protein BVY03_04575 [bacterium K02(2017)]|nr:hypothetical protein BVY03_04575 [bacterium K02(2017)]